jgi:sulfur-oxidizing protein SoxY
MSTSTRRPSRTTRRRLLGAAGAAFGAALVPPARAQMQIDIPIRAVREFARDAIIRLGRVQFEVPVLTDNGNAVPAKITVLSPMTEADHVKTIHVFAESNPRPLIAVFHLGPRAGRAEIHTRIRLAGSQRVYAVATMSDGTLWADGRDVTVTLSACIDGS